MSITITQMIAHEMDLNKEGPGLSPHVFSLNTVPNIVFDFFTNHIETSRSARQIKACSFNSEESFVYDKVNTIYDDLLNEARFIDVTRELTKDLFSKTKSAGSRSDGALFFLLYQHNNEQFLGIMKMDPNEGIQINTENFTLEVQENMLPNPKDKLHKCAFIKKTDDFENGVHLYVLDRQQKPGEVSKYFIETFLDASEIINDKIMTKRVVDKINDKILPMLSRQDALSLRHTVERTFVNGRNFDLEHDMESLISSYFSEEAEVENIIDDFKVSLREEHDDINYQFVVEKEPSILQYSNQAIKFEFPIEFLDTYVIIDENSEDSITITIRDIELTKREK